MRRRRDRRLRRARWVGGSGRRSVHRSGGRLARSRRVAGPSPGGSEDASGSAGRSRRGRGRAAGVGPSRGLRAVPARRRAGLRPDGRTAGRRAPGAASRRAGGRPSSPATCERRRRPRPTSDAATAARSRLATTRARGRPRNAVTVAERAGAPPAPPAPPRYAAAAPPSTSGAIRARRSRVDLDQLEVDARRTRGTRAGAASTRGAVPLRDVAADERAQLGAGRRAALVVGVLRVHRDERLAQALAGPVGQRGDRVGADPSSGATSAGFWPSTSRCHSTSCQRSGSEAKARAAAPFSKPADRGVVERLARRRTA